MDFGDGNKPRAWSKYSKESSAFQDKETVNKTEDNKTKSVGIKVYTVLSQKHFDKLAWLSKFYAIFTSPNQFLLDWDIGLVVFGADCLYGVTYLNSCTWVVWFSIGWQNLSIF